MKIAPIKDPITKMGVAHAFEHCDKDSSQKSKSFITLSNNTFLALLLHSLLNDFH